MDYGINVDSLQKIVEMEIKEMKKIKDDKVKELNHKFYFAVLKELFTLCDGY